MAKIWTPVRRNYFFCVLIKADFRIFYFELEIHPNKLVNLCSYFFRKIILNQNAVFYFHQKNQPIFWQPDNNDIDDFGKIEDLSWRVLIDEECGNLKTVDS